jgi:hypothetical protein
MRVVKGIIWVSRIIPRYRDFPRNLKRLMLYAARAAQSKVTTRVPTTFIDELRKYRGIRVSVRAYSKLVSVRVSGIRLGGILNISDSFLREVIAIQYRGKKTMMVVTKIRKNAAILLDNFHLFNFLITIPPLP